MDFSVVIPAFNERNRLPSFLSRLAERVGSSGAAGEIIVVDDGGREDDHRAYAEAARSIPRVPVRVLRLPVNQGKGAAIRAGFREAQGAWIGFADADGSTSAEEVVRLAKAALASELDGVFGSRILMLGYQVTRSLRRHLLGRVFATCADWLLRVPVYDSQCGCKFFRRSSVAPLLDRCEERRWLLDLELIAIGHSRHLKFLEVPISWHDVAGSKVRVLRDGGRTLVGLWRLKRRLKRGGML